MEDNARTSVMNHTLASSKRLCDRDVQTVVISIRSFLDASGSDASHASVPIGHSATLEARSEQLGAPARQRNFLSKALTPLDPSKLVLRDILTVGTEIKTTPLDRFSTDPAVCRYYVTRVRDIGKAWEINPQWTGQEWYLQILLAVSRFGRALSWYQADEHPEELLAEGDAASWSFMLSKLSAERKSGERNNSAFYYKDHKGKIHGPFKASFMDAWYRDGLLPLDLPIRREGDADYALLRDLIGRNSLLFQDSHSGDAPASLKDFDIITNLHRGDSKSVHLAKRKSTNESFVIKVVRKAELLKKNKISIIPSERRGLVILNQPILFISQIHHAFESKTRLYLVKEYFAQSDCATLIKALGHLRENMARDYIFQIVQGLEYLHQQGVIHRDLCPENILIDQGHRLKLTDFGITYSAFLNRNISGGLEQKLSNVLPSAKFSRLLSYLSPDAVLGLQDDDASIDWWAVGVISYEFLCGILPFRADELGLLVQKILTAKIDWNSDSEPSLAARDFVQSLLNLVVAARCSFHGAEGVKAHRFFDNIRDRMPAVGEDINPPAPSPGRDARATVFDPFAEGMHQHLPRVPEEGRHGDTRRIVSRVQSLANLKASQVARREHKKRAASLTSTRKQSSYPQTQSRNMIEDYCLTCGKVLIDGHTYCNVCQNDDLASPSLSDASNVNPFPTSRHKYRNSSGRSTPSSSGRGWSSLKRTASKNSSEGHSYRSSWLSGYTMTESDPESNESSFDYYLPSPGSSQHRGFNVPTHGPNLLLPQLKRESLDLTGKVNKLERYPFESGGVADIYRGRLRTSQSLVAAKIFRRMHAERETLEQTTNYLYTEARIWQQLQHPNILPFLGISLGLGLSPALISPLCESGPVMKYLHSNKKDLKERIQLVIGIANGLEYLHSQGVIHGNLCTKKILMNENGVPVICGYGMSKALWQPAHTTSLFSSSIRFAAPECFSVKSNLRTESGDVYAFSMVMLEVVSGMQPYHHLPTEHAVFLHIVRGGRPKRVHLDKKTVTNDIWRFLSSLWNREPFARPEMSQVIQSLTRMRDKEPRDEEFSAESFLDLDEESDSASQKGGSKGSNSSSGSEASDSLGDIALPEIHGRDLKGRVSQDDQYPFAGGGNSNIYRGKLTRSNGRKIRVAIKMIRISDDGSGQLEDIMRRLKREVDVWARLRHENVLPFIGVCDDLAPWPVLISPFYKFGHVGTYLRKNPSRDRLHLVRGVAAGLQYLHSRDIVHGDLKVHNVLIDKRGVPCICDFGISKILNRLGFTTASVGTAPYMAPELFFVVDGVPQEGTSSPSTTKSSDVYSFALLVLEIMTSEPPKGRPTRPIVTTKILTELQPKRADYDENKISNEIWNILKRCWEFEPQLRAGISEALRELNSVASPTLGYSFSEHVDEAEVEEQTEGVQKRFPRAGPGL